MARQVTGGGRLDFTRRAGPQPMGWLLSYHAHHDPHRPALTIGAHTMSRGELDRAANRMARALEAEGVRQDDMVPIVIRDGFEPHILAYALWKLGATPMPLSARFAPAEFAEMLALVAPRLVLSATPDEAGRFRCLPPGYTPDPSLSDAPLPERITRNWKAVPSGGSTGRPKIIVDVNPSVQDPYNLPPQFRMVKDDVIFQPALLYQNAGFALIHLGLSWGAHMIRMERFDALAWLEMAARHRVSFAFVVPTMMNRIWKLGRDVLDQYDVSALRYIMHSTAPCPEWLKRAWIDWLGPQRILEMYGATEANGGAIITGEEWLQRPGSVGRPFNPTVIVGEDGKPLPPRQIGEVYFTPAGGPGSTYRYIGGTTRARDGRESVGDLGWMDEDGYLYLVDRRTDMMIVGGSNVYPAEIEAALDAHPAVASSAVVARPDPDLGSRPHAVIEIRAGETVPTGSDLAAFLAPRLGQRKMPYSFEITHETVRDSGGKVRRSALRQRLEDQLAAGATFARVQ